jgi:glycosyltransferase involved in cell wall biosynthesis
MNILQVTLGFLPADGWGGPVKIVHANSKELVRRGHQVTVYCTNLLNKREQIQPGTFEREVDGIRVVYFNTWNLPCWPGTLGPIWLPDLAPRLQREAKSFDVIHLNGYRNFMNLPVVNIARQVDVPLVMQLHGALPIVVNSFFVKRLYDFLLGERELRHVDAVIVGQESERKQALAHGIDFRRIILINNGLDLSEIGSQPEPGVFRKRYQIPDGKPLILFLARINKKKGTDMLVDAFYRLCSESDAHLVIAGPDDGQLAEVMGLIEFYNLQKKVTLTGLLSGDEVYSALQDADLFVLPCRMDTFPMSIVEACAFGIPMVITDRCEIAHLVRGRIADVVPFDAILFAKAMRLLLSDSERYKKYKDNCPIVMQDTFSIRATGDLLVDLYRQVLNDFHHHVNL